MILIDAFTTVDGDLYHVSGPIDTEDESWSDPNWFEIAKKAGRVKLALPAMDISEKERIEHIEAIKQIRT